MKVLRLGNRRFVELFHEKFPTPNYMAMAQHRYPLTWQHLPGEGGKIIERVWYEPIEDEE